MRTAIFIAAATLALPACAEETPDKAPGLGWQIPIRVATGPAHEGPWRMNDSDFRYVGDPTVALYPGGGIGIAWVDQAEQNVFFQRFDRGEPRFDEPVNVSKSPDIFSWLPRLVIDGDNVYALWQEIVFSGGTHGGEAFFARSVDGGKTFRAPKNLSNTTNGAGKGRLTERYWHNGSLDLAKGPNNHIHAAWTEYQGPLRVRTSTDDGETWSEPVLVAGGEGELPTRGPSLAVGPDGTIHLAWTVGENPSADIRYATSTDGGQSFSEPRAVHVNRAHADAPKVAVDDKGTVHLAWMASPEGPFRSYRVVHAGRQPEADTFDEPAVISDPLPDGFDSAGFPHLSVDAQGDPHVLFELMQGRRQRGRGLALAWSTNGGDDFTKPTRIPRGGEQAAGVNGGLQGLLMDKLAVTPDGCIIVVNSTFEGNQASHVWLMRSD